MARTRRKSRSSAPSQEMPSPPETVPQRRRRAGWLVLIGLLSLIAGGVVWALAQSRTPRVYGCQVLNAHPHDANAYTQGLVFEDGFLYEGTGKYGQSQLRKVELESGRVLQAQSLPRNLFGEGITILDDRIYQLTWREGTAIVYDKDSLRELQRFRYDGEGWGLTHDGTHLIMSDGTATLRFVDPKTFRVVKQLLVRSQGRRVDKLNELEFIGGEIFANIWYKDYVARISPGSGEVTGWIDMRQLWPVRRDREAVLNGIAYDAKDDRLFVTGKNWPKLYEIRLVAP